MHEVIGSIPTVPTKEQFRVFADRRLVADDVKAPSAGLLPLTLQAVENSYSKGLQAISVTGTRTQVSLLYEERDQLHHVIAGTKEQVYQVLSFHGNEFRVAAQARFTHDEEEHPVLRVQIDFLETPCSRILKLYRTPVGWKLKQEESPNVDYLLDAVVLAAPSAARAWLTTLLGSSDADYLHWKMAQIFGPILKMKEEP